MIPAVPYRTRSTAEKRVFERLRNAFQDDNSATSFHSLNLTRHAYKRFGEIDFVVLSRYGIIVLEVKGGRVGCQDGSWHYTDRSGKVNISREGPFKQAESALHGLMEKLRANLPERIYSQITIGYGVVCPDCELAVHGAEWDSHVLLDSRNFNGFEGWLKRLIKYWRMKDHKNRELDNTALKDLKRYLRPEFEAVTPLHVVVGEAEEQVAKLTEDQMSMVDIVAVNPRVLCSGGAGTGKTFLALEVAKRWTAEGQNVLLACCSPWLKHYLEAKFVIPGLVVALASAAETAARRSGINQFDALLVDEGQDLMDMESLDHLDKVLTGGLASGRWSIFYDINNQAGLFCTPEQEAIDFLESCSHTKIPLRTNCRNTQRILKKVQNTLAADMGVKGAGEGPAIRECTARTTDKAASLLEREINVISEDGGIAHSSITILSNLPFDRSSTALLPEKLRKKIHILDEYSMRTFPPNGISFSEIGSFKGLENEAIIVVDLPLPGNDKQLKSMHYVAMSRARALLSIIAIES
jgi:hypothetical protein